VGGSESDVERGCILFMKNKHLDNYWFDCPLCGVRMKRLYPLSKSVTYKCAICESLFYLNTRKQNDGLLRCRDISRKL
jgi:DNA-directed RNA polymerase subunit RPC12/RpoP